MLKYGNEIEIDINNRKLKLISVLNTEKYSKINDNIYPKYNNTYRNEIIENFDFTNCITLDFDFSKTLFKNCIFGTTIFYNCIFNCAHFKNLFDVLTFCNLNTIIS